MLRKGGHYDGRTSTGVSIMTTHHVRRASLDDLDALGHLYDAYRQFYNMPSEPGAARAYLEARLTNGESVVFVAEAGSRVIGFCQLYPGFCSVFMGPIFVLYDMFVAPEARQQGAGAALLASAAQHADRHGALRMDLKTARNNEAAQSLYEANGWVRNDMFHEYNRMPPGAGGHA
jgi:ribosomal protein S18 acetylase RimI-like enzyme